MRDPRTGFTNAKRGNTQNAMVRSTAAEAFSRPSRDPTRTVRGAGIAAIGFCATFQRFHSIAPGREYRKSTARRGHVNRARA